MRRQHAHLPPADASPPYCKVNGVDTPASTGPETLLQWLRADAGCLDVPAPCEAGYCGACAVSVNDRAVKSCAVLACELAGGEVRTLAGLSCSGRAPVEALERAIQERHPFQCGYCKPAFIFAAYELLEQNSAPTEQDIRGAFAGLLCRCTGYQSIIDAVAAAASLLTGRGEGTG